MRQLSASGLQLLKNWESYRAYVYDDATGKRWISWQNHVGTPTIAYGYVVKPNELEYYLKNGITRQQADALLLKTLAPYEVVINQLVTAPLTQNQFDALVSFCYNEGVHVFDGSLGRKLIQLLNTKQYAEAARMFFNWERANGDPHILHNRRQKEYDLFTRA